MRMRFPRRALFLGAASALPLLAGLWLVVGQSLRHQPNLDEVFALAQAARFDEAEAQGEKYLRLFPNDPRALLVMAELALARPTPDPNRALARLERIRAGSPALAAWVRVDQGNAHFLLSRFNRAEACWNEALRCDPAAREAGRRLLDLFTLQGRAAEARSLALGQFERETDPRQRVQLLSRLARFDVDPPDPWMIINRFEPAIQSQSADLPTALACGLALTSVSRSQEGLPLLRQAVERHPDDPLAWDALMSGLELASQHAELVQIFKSLPESLKADPRFAKHRGRIEQDAGRWPEAARAYRRAWDFEPEYTVGYRLSRALYFAGETGEAKRFEKLLLDYRAAYQQVRALVEKAHAAVRDGHTLPSDLGDRMAELRERMGRSEEARAWRRIRSQSAPGDSAEIAPPAAKGSRAAS
jgi:tetratricopeptide (TPR) repeat protein